jgi:hypothetical protein
MAHIPCKYASIKNNHEQKNNHHRFSPFNRSFYHHHLFTRRFNDQNGRRTGKVLLGYSDGCGHCDTVTTVFFEEKGLSGLVGFLPITINVEPGLHTKNGAQPKSQTSRESYQPKSTMAQIKNIEGLTVSDLNHELSRGGKFVVFQYCISIIFMTFKRGSSIYFIRSGESTVKHSIGFTLLTFVFGWWGIPWGPIYSIGALYSNISGGKDITQSVLNTMNSKS